MAKILITSGPTRQYIDPVRYLSNASSGRMGYALAEAALASGHEVIIVSGPVGIDYPRGAEVVPVVSTEEMLAECRRIFPTCDGMIGVAAPSDYQPIVVLENKIAKRNEPIVLHLIETPDVVATLGADKGDRWIVGFALETQDQHIRAVIKAERKNCDMMVLNGPEAMNSAENEVALMDAIGTVLLSLSGTKTYVAQEIFGMIQERLIDR